MQSVDVTKWKTHMLACESIHFCKITYKIGEENQV